MRISDREHDEIELREAERRLADVTDVRRQTEPTEEGAAYRASLEATIAELRERLEEDAMEDDEE